MGGETEKCVSGWTIDTLRADLLERVRSLDHRIDERFDESQKVIEKAERATELRFDNVNEFRRTLNDRDLEVRKTLNESAGTFLTIAAYQEAQKAAMAYRDGLNLRFDGIGARIEALSNRMNLREGEILAKKETKETSIAQMSVIVAAVSALVSILVGKFL